MADKRKALELDIRLKNAKTVRELEAVLTDINEELKEVDENGESFKDLSQMADQATDSLDETNKSLQQAAGSGEKMTAGMDALTEVTSMFGGATGALIGKLKGAHAGMTSMSLASRGAIKGIVGLKGAMQLLKSALISTGIGALVVALGSLIAYFTQTQRGADKVSKAMAAIGAAVDAVVDRLSQIGEGLVSIFTGNWKEGVEQLQNAFKGLGDEIVREASAAMDLEEALQALERREISLIETQARRRSEVRRLQLLAEEKAITDIAAASAAMRQAISLENAIAADNIALAKEKARILNEQVALGESSNKDIREAAQANADVIMLEGERDQRLKELVSRLRGFTIAQEAANAKLQDFVDLQDSDEVMEEDLEVDEDGNLITNGVDQAMKLGEAVLAERDRQRQLEEEAEQAHFDRMISYNQWKADKIREMEEQSAEARKQIALGLYDDLIGMVNSFFGQSEEEQKKAFEFNKAVQMAENAVTTYLSATKAYASQLIPGDPTSIVRAQVAAGLAVASGIARGVMIANQKWNSPGTAAGSAGGGAQIPGGASPQPQPAPPEINLETGERTTRVFVTEGDIRETRDRVDIYRKRAVVTE